MANTIKDPRIRRWATLGLFVACALLLLKIVLNAVGVLGGPSSTVTSAPASPSADSSAARAASSLASSPVPIGTSAAELHLDELAQLNERPLPDFQRNPFQYGPTPQEIKAQQQAEELAKNPPPPVAPPPPPVPFAAIGYQQSAAGQRTAYLCVMGAGAATPGTPAAPGGHCAEDQAPYAVREGQEFGQHFKVLRITDSMVEVEDESYHQTVQLPFPQ